MRSPRRVGRAAVASSFMFASLSMGGTMPASGGPSASSTSPDGKDGLIVGGLPPNAPSQDFSDMQNRLADLSDKAANVGLSDPAFAGVALNTDTKTVTVYRTTGASPLTDADYTTLSSTTEGAVVVGSAWITQGQYQQLWPRIDAAMSTASALAGVVVTALRWNYADPVVVEFAPPAGVSGAAVIATLSATLRGLLPPGAMDFAIGGPHQGATSRSDDVSPFWGG